MISHFKTVLLTCVLALPVHAAEEESSKGISIRFFAVALHKNQGSVCVMDSEIRKPAFEIPTTCLSESQSVTTRSLVLVESTAPTGAMPVPLATLRLPDKGSDFRIILVPAENNDYRAVVVRGDDPKFSSGDFFFLNLSTHEVLGRLGTAKLDLKPGAKEIIRPGGAKSDKFFEVKFARRAESGFIPLTNTCWPVVNDNRSFLIFYNGRSGRPTYRAVDEFMMLADAGKSR